MKERSSTTSTQSFQSSTSTSLSLPTASPLRHSHNEQQAKDNKHEQFGESTTTLEKEEALAPRPISPHQDKAQCHVAEVLTSDTSTSQASTSQASTSHSHPTMESSISQSPALSAPRRSKSSSLAPPPSPNSMRRQREVAVRKVHSDNKLSAEEKRRRIRAIMLGRFRSVQESSHSTPCHSHHSCKHPHSDESAAVEEKNLPSSNSTTDCGDNGEPRCRKTYHNAKKGVLGCKHYARKCRMKAACCGRYVGCRLCHNEQCTDHKIDRKATRLVGCMVCGALDLPAGTNCTNCNVEFASYYCEKCKFWDDNVVVGEGVGGKRVFHCDGCGACRVGKGLGIDNEHCYKCGHCYPKSQFAKHRCVERSLETNCPICFEPFKECTKEIRLMKRCGHAMHKSCYERHAKTSFTCPICKQSWRNMNHVFRQLDKRVESDWQNMPCEYRNKVSEILCQDCHKQSQARFHFLYHKCANCQSYNTRTVRVFESSMPLANIAPQATSQASTIIDKNSSRSIEITGNRALMEANSLSETTT